jgi:hypothetical protein
VRTPFCRRCSSPGFHRQAPWIKGETVVSRRAALPAALFEIEMERWTL